MTDNDIKRELQSAMEWFDEHGRNTNTAIIGICERALDLINRLEAEGEKLCEEIDVLIIAKDLLFDEAEALIKKAKAEAYKECAEKIKQKTLAMIYSTDELTTDDYIKCIDDVVKELEGEKDGKL